MFPRSPLSPLQSSNYKIVCYSPEHFDIWDDFVEHKSINGTFLHTRKFYNHNPRNQADDKSYLFYKKSKLIGVIGCILDNKERLLISHSRSTYGGFVVSKDVGVEDALAIVQLFIEEAKKKQLKQIVIKNPFRIFYKKPCDEFDYALWYFGFTILNRQLEITIPLNKTSKLETDYSEGTRSGLHKAKKTLTVEESDDYVKFWSLLETTLKFRHDKVPTHNYQDFCELLKCVGSDKIKLFVTKKNDQIIAGTVLFILNSICVHSQYVAYDMAHQNDRPLNILLYEVSKWAQQQGYSYFNLGTANEDNGNIVNFNLFKFKESYGGRGVLRETMQIKL